MEITTNFTKRMHERRKDGSQIELSTTKLNSFNLIWIFRPRYQINLTFQFHFVAGIKESVSMGNGVYVRSFAKISLTYHWSQLFSLRVKIKPPGPVPSILCTPIRNLSHSPHYWLYSVWCSKRNPSENYFRKFIRHSQKNNNKKHKKPFTCASIQIVFWTNNEKRNAQKTKRWLVDSINCNLF